MFLLMIALYIAVTLQPIESTAAFVAALWLGNGSLTKGRGAGTMTTPLLTMVALLLAYGIGRRVGLREGQSFGRASAIVDIRAESLKKDYCVICLHQNQKDLTNSITKYL